MSITSIDSLIEDVQALMGASYNKVSTDGFERAISQALNELHWTLPITESMEEYWVIERSKRYVVAVLLTESAHKFQYKQIHLNNRFNQYFKLIKFYDDEFANAIENNPTLFDIDTWGNLADYITVGFQYDGLGTDITYDGWE